MVERVSSQFTALRLGLVGTEDGWPWCDTTQCYWVLPFTLVAVRTPTRIMTIHPKSTFVIVSRRVVSWQSLSVIAPS